MGVIDRVFRRQITSEQAIEVLRADPTMSVEAWAAMFQYAGNTYGGFLQQTLAGQPAREVSQTYAGYIQGVYKANSVVFACMAVRMLLFSEARFQFRQMRNGKPGDLFGTQELQILEQPWVNGTTGDLLSRAIQDVDLDGNFYAYRDGNELRRMRPDWVSIALSGTNERDVEVIGYGYHPGGYNSGQQPIPMLPEQVLHFAPYPDPQARFRGMSWLTPVLDIVLADDAATTHKRKFFENGATPNMVIGMDPALSKEAFDDFVTKFQRSKEGVDNAYKTLFLRGGTGATVVGSSFQQMSFKETQGAGETRIAAAAGVPPIIVGLSEGLEASTYSNYFQATRRFADGTLRPLWRNFAASAQRILNVPGGADLWYDDRGIAFLQDDETASAAVEQTKAGTMRTLIEAGFDAQSVITAVTNSDLTLLVDTGLRSVQLQPTPSPEMFDMSYAAGWTQTQSLTVKALVDVGYQPDTVIQAVMANDLTLLQHAGQLQVQLAPSPIIPEGKGAIVTGQAVPVGQNGARALLMPWLPTSEGDE